MKIINEFIYNFIIYKILNNKNIWISIKSKFLNELFN